MGDTSEGGGPYISPFANLPRNELYLELGHYVHFKDGDTEVIGRINSRYDVENQFWLTRLDNLKSFGPIQYSGTILKPSLPPGVYPVTWQEARDYMARQRALRTPQLTLWQTIRKAWKDRAENLRNAATYWKEVDYYYRTQPRR